MLEPRERLLLLDSLRPPLGYSLEYAVGATYSLDLTALLTIPLAFTMFEVHDRDGRQSVDSLAILEALRRHASQIDIFCQAGKILVPAPHLTLFHLEERIHQVRLPRGAFHPKLWAIKYRSESEPAFIRVLCLTRNLTFDRCWDAMVVLEGQIKGRAIAANRGLADFVRALPSLPADNASSETAQKIGSLADDLLVTDFGIPTPFEELAFWPLGIPAISKKPFKGTFERTLTISPFISGPQLSELPRGSRESILISRLEDLDNVSRQHLKGYGTEIYTLTPEADPDTPEPGEEQAPKGGPLKGLHAKLYLLESGRTAELWLGSANATSAAFNHNVEFLVRLSGPRNKAGIDVFLGSADDEASLKTMLSRYKVDAERPADSPEQQLDDLLRQASEALCAADFASTVKSNDNGTYAVQVAAAVRKPFPANVAVKTWLVTLDESSAVPLAVEQDFSAQFDRVSVQALSRFVAFELTGELNGTVDKTRFVLCMPMRGAPEDRQSAILRSLLHSREQVLRFLLFLLADDMSELAPVDQRPPSDENTTGGKWSSSEPDIFESLVKALARHPEKLDDVAHLIADLRKDPDGARLLPEGFDLIWAPILEARQGLMK
jgi:hypothetical protein